MLSQDNKNIIVRLTSAGAVLQTLEAPIPYPVPGARLGIANVATLVALKKDLGLGFADCLVMVFARVITASFLVGNFLTPGFMISIVASPLSFIAMYLVSRLGIFSIIGVSIVGAVVHNLAQLTAVYIFFMRQTSLLTGILPIILSASGLVSGAVTGFVASKLFVLRNQIVNDKYPAVVARVETAHKNFPTYSWGKIAIAFPLIITVVLVNANRVLFFVNIALLTLVFGGRCRFSPRIFIKKYSAFAPFGIAVFVLPAVFGKDFTEGIISFLKVFAVFQISAYLFPQGELKDKAPVTLPSLSEKKAFHFFPLNFLARVWDVSSRALLIAPSLREDLLDRGRFVSETSSRGFYRRLLAVISVRN